MTMTSSRLTRRTAIIVMTLALVFFGCDAFTGDAYATSEPAASATEATRIADEGAVAKARDLSVAFQRVAEEIQPSVVSISTRRQVTVNEQRSPFPDSPFGDLFGRFFDQPGGPRSLPQQGLGSGFIVSEDGYIVTNHHVIDGADDITVHTMDERELKAELVGSDPRTDIAVLRVEADDLQAARFGSSAALKVGEWVVAVGNPFGLTSTITAGIVSATGRSNLHLADYENFIQTDAAINPGNSGGPLVNLDGEVVGINTAIFSRSGGYMGIGFAIPADMARTVMDSLIEDGHVSRGWLGAWIQDLDKDMARSFGLDSTEGVLIGDVDPKGPAAAAGLKSGDIVLRLDGREVSGADELRFAVAEKKPGTEVGLEVFRDGRSRTVRVELGELESDEAVMATGGTARGFESSGMTVQTLTPELAAGQGYDSNLRGALVTQVEPGSPAARAGIRPGDVVLAVMDQAVGTAGDLRRELSRHDLEEGVRLTLQSDQARRFVFLKAQ